jgi:hypothetical protein
MNPEAGFRTDDAPGAAVASEVDEPAPRVGDDGAASLPAVSALDGGAPSPGTQPMESAVPANQSPGPATSLPIGDQTDPEPASRPEPPRRRIPDCDIIDVGRRAAAAEVVDVLDLVPPGLAAAFLAKRDDVSGPGDMTRPLLALLALAIAVVGGIHLSKRLTASQVIVVPTTLNENTVIT